MDSFHIWYKWLLAWEGVSHVMTFDLDLYLQGLSTLFWLGIQHDSIVWVIMRRWGVSSERRRSSSYYSGIILCMHPANGKWCYNVTSSLFGCVHIQNDPWLLRNLGDTYIIQYKKSWYHSSSEDSVKLTHCGLMTPNDAINRHQHCLIASNCQQAITWTNFDMSSIKP